MFPPLPIITVRHHSFWSWLILGSISHFTTLHPFFLLWFFQKLTEWIHTWLEYYYHFLFSKGNVKSSSQESITRDVSVCMSEWWLLECSVTWWIRWKREVDPWFLRIIFLKWIEKERWKMIKTEKRLLKNWIHGGIDMRWDGRGIPAIIKEWINGRNSIELDGLNGLFSGREEKEGLPFFQMVCQDVW